MPPSQPAAHFRVLALVAPVLDVRAGLRLRRARRTMADAEVTEMLRVLRSLPASVADWSDGNVAFDLVDVEVLDNPVRTLTRSGADRWWVAPADVSGAIGRFADGCDIDSIILVHPTDGSVPMCGWGCTIGPSAGAAGAGFSSITSDSWQSAARGLHPEEGFVHEWLHQVEHFYRGAGLVGHLEFPDLHDVGGRTSTREGEPPFGRPYVDWERETGTWQPWYRDLMTGTVGPKDAEQAPVGLTRARWAMRER